MDLLVQLCAELAERKEINVEIHKRTGWKKEAIKKKRQALRSEIEEAVAQRRQNNDIADLAIEPVPEIIESSSLPDISSFIENKTDQILRLVDNINCFERTCQFISLRYPNKQPKAQKCPKPVRKPTSTKRRKDTLQILSKQLPEISKRAL